VVFTNLTSAYYTIDVEATTTGFNTPAVQPDETNDLWLSA